jgi:hypothetical protein
MNIRCFSILNVGGPIALRTADKLFIVQPALTKQIQENLEKAWGMKLLRNKQRSFDRNGHFREAEQQLWLNWKK